MLPPIAIGVTWKAPTHGWLKLNIDEPFVEDPKKVWTRAISKDHDGGWIDSPYHISLTISVEVKLWQLRDGFQVAKSINVGYLESKVDATSVINFMSNKNDINDSFCWASTLCIR